MKYIYAVKFSNYSDLIKIGCSQEPDRRAYVLSFTHGNVVDMEKIEAGEDGFDIEDYLHWYFKEQRVNTFGDGQGEFFKFETSFDSAVELITHALESYNGKDNDNSVYHEVMPELLSNVIRNFKGGFSSTEKFILLIVMSYADTGLLQTRPVSFKELCRASALSRRTVVYSVNKLESAGLIERHRMNHCSSNYYTLNVGRIEEICEKG